jgi:hypothetical protein
MKSATEKQHAYLEQKWLDLFNNEFENPNPHFELIEIVDLELDTLLNATDNLGQSLQHSLIGYINVFRRENKMEQREDTKEWIKQNNKTRTNDKKDKEFSLEDFNPLIETIEELEERVALTLVASFRYGVLRSDYSSVKIKNYNKEEDNYYENHVITFNNLRKVNKEQLTIELQECDKKLFDEYIANNTSDYLFHLQVPSSFCKWIKKISLRHLNKDYTISDYRKLNPMVNLSKCKTPAEFVKKQEEIAMAQNHSVATQNKYYIKEAKQEENSVIEFIIGDKRVKIVGREFTVNVSDL